ncbi:MAG: cyclodeaminase/cyclohydrolase family protein [Candidatus Limnocylindria bacterium]
MADDESLASLSLEELAGRLASAEPVPGGGSAAALAGVLGAALVSMVVELTHQSGSQPQEDRVALSHIGEGARARLAELLELADRDSRAYAAMMRARRLPRSTNEQRATRGQAISQATADATRVPLQTARAAAAVVDLAARVAPIGNPNAASDAGVAALLSTAAMRAAALNVRINLPFLAPENGLVREAPRELVALDAQVSAGEARTLAAVAERMG